MSNLEIIERQFEATLAAASLGAGSRRLPGVDLVIATSTGPVRSENQDRVAVIRGQLKGQPSASFLAIALADGMGGMVAGAECATIALSAFFAYLTADTKKINESSLASAFFHANRQVYARFGGRGGSTLTALVVDSFGQGWLAHVGDSRAYLFSGGKSGSLRQISVDDTLSSIRRANHPEYRPEEGENSLLQYVGMGEDFLPHAEFLDSDIKHHSFLLTSDGVHFLGQDTIKKILQNTDNAVEACNRLLRVADWISGHDNGTVAFIRPPTFAKFFEAKNRRQNICSLWSISQTTEFISFISEYDPKIVETKKAGALSPQGYDLTPRLVSPEFRSTKRSRLIEPFGSMSKKKVAEKSKKATRQVIPQFTINLIEPDDDKS